MATTNGNKITFLSVRPYRRSHFATRVRMQPMLADGAL